MTKKLIWRLKEQPSTQSLLELVNANMLTKDEAREILFSSQTEEDRDKKSLESEIKFLREVVEKLSENKTKTIEIIREIYKPYHQWNWYQPYYYWCNGTAGNTLYATNTSGNNTTYLANANTANTVVGMSISYENGKFTDIKTF